MSKLTRFGIWILVAFVVQAWAVAPALGQQQTTEEPEEIYVYGKSLEAALPQELAAYGSDLVSLGRNDVEQKVYVDPTADAANGGAGTLPDLRRAFFL